MQLLKRIAAKLPDRWQTELNRIHCGRQIRRGTFVTQEPEYKILADLIGQGDWVIDIGANVGHYTKRFSELVGPKGRVIAFEPVPTTFYLLSANVQHFAYPNVSLINAAVSNKLDLVGMDMPKFSTGLTNYYDAHLSSDGAFSVMTLPLDSLGIDHRVALVKVDAEDHEAFVLGGMQQLIRKHRPILIVETGVKDVIASLTSLGYTSERLPKSPNVLFRPVPQSN